MSVHVRMPVRVETGPLVGLQLMDWARATGPVSLRDTPAPVSPTLESQASATTPAISCEFLELNSGPQACKASMEQSIKPPPQ